jgi:hypothetical protein
MSAATESIVSREMYDDAESRRERPELSNEKKVSSLKEYKAYEKEIGMPEATNSGKGSGRAKSLPPHIILAAKARQAESRQMRPGEHARTWRSTRVAAAEAKAYGPS